MTAETDKAALRSNLVRACFDPGSFIGPRGSRTTDEWRAGACLHLLAPVLAQAEADRAEIERLKAVLDFEKRARRVAEARADRLAAKVEARADEALRKAIRAWSAKLHIPVTRMMSRVLREEFCAAFRAADKPGERTE